MEVLLNLLIAVVVIIAICIVFFFIMRNADKKRLDSLEDEEVEIAEVNFHNAKVVKKYIMKKTCYIRNRYKRRLLYGL